VKRFVRGDYAKTRQVAEALYRHSRQAVQASGLPVLEVPGCRQRGHGFGERLANAVADAFARGYDRVVAVGGDCPRLHEVDWERAVQRLERGEPVLGPTPGGEGVYLIGMTRAQFDRRGFAALPWKTPALFRALADHLARKGGARPALLPARGDVNGHEDLVALVRKGGRAPLLVRLRRVLGTPAPARRRPASVGFGAHAEGRRTRAPPAGGAAVTVSTSPSGT
jgi:2-phospho-L-lactate guanylyltransferase (CobY/MobA/RfbA family)